MLHDNIYHLEIDLNHLNFLSEGNSPIQVIHFQNRDKLMDLVEKFWSQEFTRNQSYHQRCQGRAFKS